jgi:hypothetical protein
MLTWRRFFMIFLVLPGKCSDSINSSHIRPWQLPSKSFLLILKNLSNKTCTSYRHLYFFIMNLIFARVVKKRIQFDSCTTGIIQDQHKTYITLNLPRIWAAFNWHTLHAKKTKQNYRNLVISQPQLVPMVCNKICHSSTANFWNTSSILFEHKFFDNGMTHCLKVLFSSLSIVCFY